ncbi:hypothetical protein GCM10009091_31420 [Pseudomonas brenneri]|nr:formylglycine-generating enzyme family protein [Pseudomonas brenneri]GGL47329.1 hypothetical protein GCM10009091_31420 [Pseudomonas brenneri]SDU86241.1 Formylglycine-generating enzyme, required for sulfatase activity, contains SUMF1/FGE domain [Pseudomonas brenneri]
MRDQHHWSSFLRSWAIPLISCFFFSAAVSAQTPLGTPSLTVQLKLKPGNWIDPPFGDPKRIDEWALSAIRRVSWAFTSKQSLTEPNACGVRAILMTAHAKTFRHHVTNESEASTAARVVGGKLLNEFAVFDIDVFSDGSNGRIWSWGKIDQRQAIQLYIDENDPIALTPRCAVDHSKDVLTCALGHTLQTITPQLAQAKQVVLTAWIVDEGPRRFELNATDFKSNHASCVDFVTVKPRKEGQPDASLPAWSEPEMLAIPAGTFLMGDPPEGRRSGRSERPQREIQVAAFALGKSELTFNDWDACVHDGACSHVPDDEGWGRGTRPVIHVSYQDVTGQYLPWLNKKTGKRFRLPSEAEWEYAARAGTASRYLTGACLDASVTNVDGRRPAKGCPSSHYRGETTPVGQFPPNAFGLHDMVGNVMELTEGCWNDSHADAPPNAIARTDGDCGLRAQRGGAWISYAQYATAGSRVPILVAASYKTTGVRLAISPVQ